MPLPTLLAADSLTAAGARPGETPLEYITRWLRTRMPEYGGSSRATMADRVLVVRARTGSGKSTVLPVGVYRLLRSEKAAPAERLRAAGVVCTQPRVLTAISLANDVSSRPWNPDMVLGETVGFQTGSAKNMSHGALAYATVGTLLAQLRVWTDDEVMGRYRIILVDEAHERSLDSDLALMALRNFYARNEGAARLPFLMLTSATFDPARYAEFFGLGAENVVDVAGSAYPVETRWPAHGAADYCAAAAEAAAEIHREGRDDDPGRGDVLIFLPGVQQIAEVARLIEDWNEKWASRALEGEKSPPPMYVIRVTGPEISGKTRAYRDLFAPLAALPPVGGRKAARRVVLATNAAETGLTVDTLRYVVDAGWTKSVEAYAPRPAAGLVQHAASRASATQRRGRVGRLFPGVHVPLYTRAVFDALDEDPLPDVVRAPFGPALIPVVVDVARAGLRAGRGAAFRLGAARLLDAPPAAAFHAAWAEAVATGIAALDAPLPARWPPEAAALWAADTATAAGADAATAAGADAATAAEADAATAAEADADAGAVSAVGPGLTPLGWLAAAHPRSPPEVARLLLAGYAWGVAASDLATAAAVFGRAHRALVAYVPGPRPRAPLAAALAAALPPFLTGRGAGGLGARAAPPLHDGSAFADGAEPAPPPDERDWGREPPASEEEAAYYRGRLLLACEYAETVLIFDAFARGLEAEQGDVGGAAARAAALGLAPAELFEIARRRDEIMGEAAAAGLDPFRLPGRRLGVLPPAEFGAGLRAFKRCLHDALRARVAEAEPTGDFYRLPDGTRFRPAPLLDKRGRAALRAESPGRPARPRWALTDLVVVAPVPRRGDSSPFLYETVASRVCYLDGAVAHDPGFCEPREFPP